MIKDLQEHHDDQVGQGFINVQSEKVIRKCIIELDNKNVETTNWISNIYNKWHFKTLLNGKIVKGYVHELNLFGEIYFTWHMEEQLKAL